MIKKYHKKYNNDIFKLNILMVNENIFGFSIQKYTEKYEKVQFVDLKINALDFNTILLVCSKVILGMS